MSQPAFVRDVTAGVNRYLFHWGWLLFFAGIPFLGWSAFGLLLILIHWILARPQVTVDGSSEGVEPGLYRIAMLGLLAAYALSIIPAVDSGHALGTGIGFGLVLLFGLKYAYRLELARPGWWRVYIWPVPLTGTASALVGLSQYWQTSRRVMGIHSNPNAYATALLISLFIGVAALSTYRDNRRWLILPYASIVVSALLTSGSRGAWVGALAGFSVFVILLVARQWRGQRARALALGAGGAVVAIALLLVVYSLAGPVLQSRMVSIVDISANQDRVVLYETMGRMIKAHPWLGVGMGNIGLRYAEFQEHAGVAHDIAHNYFLQSLGETGIVGTVFLVLLWFVWLVRGWPARGEPVNLLLYSLLVALLVRDQFDNALSITYILFLLNWLGGTVVAAGRRQPEAS